ncbi:T9SS type A sorting domain-containing protein [Fluviicola taffensis]|uniref:Secretion system C-terminal sorting domain-containing protein n=1 Tax=Fluviicola taffensis (strain DSM 16823 / NCIMB 13979 / RW262) TaxID=755732 RepID=F2IDZ6_FLUTR|nr:T9SS type A sorting domain-containing protein [Fluviicola taffensis]AEA45560.1 hypothetical protein Fluta_3591 [Fluviicola taffensis DSM 16823]
MKSLLILFSISFVMSVYSQSWHTITKQQLGIVSSTMFGGYAPTGTRYFKINPYNNSIWFALNFKAFQLTNDGQFHKYDTSNTSVLQTNSKVFDFAFTPNYTFVMDGTYGLQQFNGTTWNLAIPFSNGINLAYDSDSIWCIRTNQNYIKWFGGFNSQGNYAGFRKAISKNGAFWGGGETSGVSSLDNNDVHHLYSPDTCKLIDWGNYDFKFCRNTDSMYVSCTGGLSIADGYHFIDSICPANSTNMPSGIIIEFEFDKNDNIWALFGDSFFKSSSIAFLNTTTKVWSNFYNTSNSPIKFNTVRTSIEIDTTGNLWVIDQDKLNVLDLGTTPVWLGLKDFTQDNSIEVIPNPTTEYVQINFSEAQAQLRIMDLQGKEIESRSIQNEETISVAHLKQGVYLFEVTTHQGKNTKRIVKN